MSEEEIQEEQEDSNETKSDQDLSDNSMDTKEKIKEGSNIFQNEKMAIKILLSKHYDQFRENLKQILKNNKIGVHEEINKQIRNILDNYSMKLDKKDENIPIELNALITLLKKYYNHPNFNEKFFINYFKYIREMNIIKEESISPYPKDEIETLNDIERKVEIIKDLDYYLNKQIRDRLEIKFDSKYINNNNPYSELKFNYLVIDDSEFLKMDGNILQEYLNDKAISNALRRPLKNNSVYNYLPILCEGSCIKEAELFNNEFEKWITNHLSNEGCEKCVVEILENLDKIKSEIRSLYIKTCIFSHNMNEIMFHPLNLMTMSSFDDFYKNQLTQKPNENIKNLTRKNNIPFSFSDGKYKKQKIYKEDDEIMKEIINKLVDFSIKTGLYEGRELENQIIPIEINQNQNHYEHHENNIENDEELIHYISDQDLSEDNYDTSSIIKEKSNVFQNETIVIKILLSKHYNKFRNKFFQNIQKNKIGVHEEIQQQIRNILNSYRIKIDKDKDEVISNELQELINSLRSYYKKSNFDNTFFVNYFKDIREMNKSKKKFINNYPRNETETLNDIERKVKIIKDLNHYLNTQINDRIQINFDSHDYYNKEYSELKFNYLVINNDDFSKMDENSLKENLSDKCTSNKLRRPLTSYIAFNYQPILCKGSCIKEAEFFNNEFEKWIINHINNEGCEKCVEILENLDRIKSQIRSLYIKTCIFSHNMNEIMFHPLNLMTMSSFDKFYKNQLMKKHNQNIDRFVRKNDIPTLFRKGKYEIQIIYNPAQEGMKAIYNKLLDYSKKTGLYIKCCYKSELKIQQCPLKFNPDNYEFYTHMKKCPHYHTNLEKRRIYKITSNEICENAIHNGEWLFNKEKVECVKGDYCPKFHTRNELFFDDRYYRKLYPCTEQYYCDKDELCPKKHAIDIKIDEIFLPKKNKKELKEILEKLIKKDEKFKNTLKKFNIIQCVSCLNLISGIHDDNMIFFLNCKHRICSKCYEFYKFCPLCGFNFNGEEKNEEKNKINILLNYKLSKIKKKKKSEEEKENSLELLSNKTFEIYDNDIPFSKNENNSPYNNYYNQNNGYKSFNRNFNNNFQDNFYNNNKYYNGHNRSRGRGRGRRGKGRGRGRDSYEQQYYKEREDNYYNESNNNYNEVNSINLNDDNDNKEYSREIRRGKGRVRGSTRSRIENSNINIDNEKKEYYLEKEESENNSNIIKFKEKVQNEEKDNSSHKYEEEFSMKKGEIRKGKGRVRGGKKGRHKEREREREEEKSNSKEDDRKEGNLSKKQNSDDE